MIELNHISKSYGKTRALDDVSLSIGPGELVGLFGENGAGKTTLMKCILSLIRYDSGSVTLDGAAITPPAPLHTDLLPAATEKLPALLPADAAHGPVLDVTPGLEDALSDALERDDPMVALRVASMADVNALADCQYLLTKPLCLICGDAAVLEQALRVYQGRALYEGGLTEEKLKDLAGKYGVIY